MRLAAVGDGFFWRRYAPGPEDASFRAWRLVAEADVAFVNLEGPIGSPDAYPVKQYSWGGYPSADEWVAADLARAGFDLVSLANNHVMNYSYPAIRANLDLLRGYGLVVAGAGVDLAEARRPQYLNSSSGDVGFIAIDSSYEWGEFVDVQMASYPRGAVKGRPGVNGLRWDIRYEVQPDIFADLRKFLIEVGRLPGHYFPQWSEDPDSAADPPYRSAVGTGMWLPGPDDIVFMGRRFHRGSENGVQTTCHVRDLEAVLNTVREAKNRAAYVIVSLHSHEGDGHDPTQPAGYVVECAHRAVEMGADVVIGHGSPWKGFEIYHGRPIFYDLGKFVTEYHLSTHFPADLFDAWGLDPDATVDDYFWRRNALFASPKSPHVEDELKLFDHGFIALASFTSSTLTDVRLVAVSHGENGPLERMGSPMLLEGASAQPVLQQMLAASRRLGTRARISGDAVVANLD